MIRSRYSRRDLRDVYVESEPPKPRAEKDNFPVFGVLLLAQFIIAASYAYSLFYANYFLWLTIFADFLLLLFEVGGLDGGQRWTAILV